MCSEVREPLKEDRSELRLHSLRTPEGLRCGSGEDMFWEPDVGDMGTRKLSVGCCCLWFGSCSGSGVGGKAPGTGFEAVSGVVG
jgi:hypothetical protein